MAIADLSGNASQDRGVMMAAVGLSISADSLLYIVAQRWFVEGIAMTGQKGIRDFVSIGEYQSSFRIQHDQLGRHMRSRRSAGRKFATQAGERLSSLVIRSIGWAHRKRSNGVWAVCSRRHCSAESNYRSPMTSARRRQPDRLRRRDRRNRIRSGRRSAASLAAADRSRVRRTGNFCEELAI